MRVASFLAVAMTSAVLLQAAPSHAQQSTTNLQRQTTAKPATVNSTMPAPVRRDHRTNSNTRDHRATATNSAPGGVKVTASGRKRQGSSSSPCIRSILGGPCMGGTVGKVAKGVAKIEPVSVGATGVYGAAKQTFGDSDKRSGTRDHRKKN